MDVLLISESAVTRIYGVATQAPAVKMQAASLVGAIVEDQLADCRLQSNINCPFPRSHSQAISLHL